MNLETIEWNPQSYSKFVEYLYTLQDVDYKNFHGKLIQNQESLIGIRTPILKEIAKKISKNNPYTFLQVVEHNTYEETVIHGLVIGYMKISFDACVSLLNDFLPYNTNWAINDITCANLKIWKTRLDEGLAIIEQYLKNENLWIRRFGLVLLLDFYVNDDYIDTILKIIPAISGSEYYVGMANAWLISVCFVHYPEKTKVLLESNQLDFFTQKHAIQKILESNRVSLEEKENMRKLREQIGKSLI